MKGLTKRLTLIILPHGKDFWFECFLYSIQKHSLKGVLQKSKSEKPCRISQKKKEKEETVAHDQMDYASGYPGGFMISIKQKGSFKNYVCVSWGYSLLMFKSFALGNF